MVIRIVEGHEEEFAATISVSVSTINRWETGKTKPNLTALKSLKQFCEKYELPYENIESEWFSHSAEGTHK